MVVKPVESLLWQLRRSSRRKIPDRRAPRRQTGVRRGRTRGNWAALWPLDPPLLQLARQLSQGRLHYLSPSLFRTIVAPLAPRATLNDRWDRASDGDTLASLGTLSLSLSSCFFSFYTWPPVLHPCSKLVTLCSFLSALRSNGARV